MRLVLTPFSVGDQGRKIFGVRKDKSIKIIKSTPDLHEVSLSTISTGLMQAELTFS